MAEADLFLVRHGIAEESDLARWPDDRERPLTPEGEESFRRAAEGLARIAPPAAMVLSSPLVRARQTAAILREAGWPAADLLDELAPETDPATTLKALEGAMRAERIALVGHEPHLSALVSLLAGGGRVEMKKGGVARLRVSALRPGGATLRWLLPPKTLRAAR